MEILRPLLVLSAFCILLFFATYIFRLVCNFERRLAMLQALVVIGGLVWFITEFLSLFKAITLAGLAVLWGIVWLTTLAIITRVPGGKIGKAILTDLRAMQGYLVMLPRGLLAMLIFMFVGMSVLGLIAFVAAPNTWDSMTYHLSRVMHWEQNRSLAFYPTSISRQLHLGPMAEMAILNFQILAGNDRLANFVQFIAMTGCVVGVSIIAKLIGGNAYAQLFASLAVMTLPMGVLQSTSTQNDYVVAFWLVCFVSFALKQLQTDTPSRTLALFAGISLGLAIVTKVTVLIFGTFFGVWLVFGLILRSRIRAWKPLTILLCATLLVITPHACRNYKLYRNPLGPMIESKDDSYRYTNDSYGVRTLVSNVLRNIAIHLAFPFEGVNDDIERAVLFLHAILKMDANYPGTTWTGTKFRVKYSTNEDLAGNPFHLILIIVSAALLGYHKETRLKVFIRCVVAGFVLFSWLLKWQPWHSRLHLPLFILAMPFVGVVLSKGQKWWVLYLVVLGLCLMSLRYVFQNPTRPLVGRDNVLITNRLNQYFSSSPDKFMSYQQVSMAIGDQQCTDIGLMTNIDDWEYPLWVMTEESGSHIHFEHILVDNPSGTLETGFAPCAIIVTYPIQEQTVTYRSREFTKIQEDGPLSLFVLQAQ